MTCLKSNFSLETASGEINQSLFGKYNNIDELINNIKNGLKECSFSTTLEESNDDNNYQQSVDLLINTILDKLNDVSVLGKKKIKRELSKFLLPNTSTNIKPEVTAIIPDAELFSEQERKSREYNDILDEFFQENGAAKSRREEILSSELLLSSIIDTKTGTIVANAKDLNSNLERFKADEYIKIRKYLENLGYSGYADGMYSKHKLNVSSFNNLLKDIYNIIQDKIQNETFKTELLNSWIDSVMGKSSDFYDVVNAYINLMYFDKVLDRTLGTYIKIDDSLIEPITSEINSIGKIETKYKYSFNSGNAETIKGWETAENRDAIKEMGKFSKLIIESIPLYNYHNKEKLNVNLNAVRFSNAITRLFDISNQLDAIEYADFLELINHNHFKSEQHFPKILDMLFSDNHKSLVRRLKDLGLTDFDLNVLYSIRKQVYQGVNSYNTVEQKFINEHGELTSRYPIVRSILGIVDSTVAMNYLQHKYNYNDGEYQTSVKIKYPTDRVVYDMTTNINRNIVNESDKSAVLEKYLIETDGNHYEITIGSNYKFTVKSDSKGRGLGALNKTNTSSRYASIEYLPDINPETSDYRKKLLSRKGLSRTESNFMEILSFIDDMLHTTFSKDEDGLIEYNVFRQLDNHGLENLLLAASRGLIITDIYNKFENERKSLGLTKIELSKYLELNPDIYPFVNISKLDSKDRKHLLRQHISGEYLTTVSDSEQWLHNLSHAKAILSGEVSKAVIKNLENDSIPNFSPAFEGAFIKRRGTQAKEKGDASAYLLFSENPNALKQVVVDTDVSVQDGRKKSIKNMTKGELLLHSIVDKYFLPQLQQGGNLIIQPTTYSDKTKFINYIISSKLKGDIDLSNASTDQLEDLILNSIGKYYQKIWQNVLDDYEILFGTRDIKEISDHLKLHTEESLVALGKSKGVEIHVDTHYRTINKKLQINELLNHYANHTYANKQELQKRLAKEKIKFVESLIKNRVHFNLSFDKGDLTGSKNDLTTVLLNKLGSKKAENWVSGQKMIIAKVMEGTRSVNNIVFGTKVDLKPGQTLQLNPLLENFFMVHTLVGNNGRFILSGSEINHKVKALGKLNLSKTSLANFTNILSNYGLTDLSTASLVDLDYTINLMEAENDANAKVIREIYDSHVYTLESQAQNAQLKRNVIIPATLRYYLQDTLNGVTDTLKLAVTNDIPAEVFNFDGISNTIDAHDGAALEEPFTSRLENLSLQDNEVGTIKKPIWHHYDHRYGTAFLAKYAVHTMTNQWMRQSEASTISLQNLFKKMTNLQWKENIDLIEGCNHRKGIIDFDTNILEGQKLYYKKGNKHYQILDFKRDQNGDYYTVEIEVSATGNNMPGATETDVYHYFDKLGNHSHIKTINNHTINSLYELHSALGGIWCESLTNNGLQYSEASVNAVVNFMNSVTVLKPGADPNIETQSSYRQPLKEYVISYVANNSSIKNGAANRNSNKIFTDPYTGNEDDLAYMIVSTEGHGVQMDADHTSDEAQMTEFSQVISSLDAGGRLHSYVKQIYNVLGQVALEQAQLEVSALEEFNKSGNISSVYDIVGRTIINNLASKKGQAGLAESIIKTIKKQFDLNSDHEADIFKIPFSDPNIYSNILSTFVSIINNKSIKRKYPGQGTVMVPGYGMSQIWEFGGRTYQYEDLIKLAQKNLKNINDFDKITDISAYNKAIVNAYLKQQQDQVLIVPTLDSFMPTDNVLVSFIGERFNVEALNTDQVEYEITKEPWKDDPTHLKNVLKIYIKGHKELGSFDLVKDAEFGNYSVHFKTGNGDTGETYGSTKEQRSILYENLYRAIPEGANVSTWGNVSEGGVYALNKLMDEYLGDIKVDNQVGTRTVRNRDNTQDLVIPVFKKFGIGQIDYNESTQRQINVSLHSIKDYYDFKEDPIKFLNKKGYYNISSISYQKNIMKARDLAPAKISFKYKDKAGVEYETNIFDTWALKEAYKLGLERSNPKVQANVQLVLDGLERGVYLDANGNEIGIITQIINTPAELIMSNIYKSRFGIKDGQSLVDVLNDPLSFKKESEIINSDFYDLVYTRGNGNHLYITFNRFKPTSESFDYSKKEWNYINRTKFNQKNRLYTYNPETKIYDENGVTILNKIYATDRNNIRLFEIGRDILRPDVQYDTNKRKFIDSTGKVLKDQKRFRRISESKVAEYVEFVHRYEVIEDGKKCISYNIDKKALARVLAIKDQEKSDIEVNLYISTLLSKIYKSQSHSGIQIQTKLKRDSAILLEKTLKGLGNNLAYNSNLKDLLYKIQDLLDGATKLPVDEKGREIKSDYIVSTRKYNVIQKKYLDKLKNNIASSFEKAQFFTASRIPAQTLQSFMQMRCVGYTGTATNQCFVSHWQTWLQGSDYDIDKAYIMGHSFDDNGVYIGWSNLFDYSSLEALQASEQLPMPQRRKYKLDANGYDLTQYDASFASANTADRIKLLTKILNDLNEIKPIDGKVLINSSSDSIIYQSIISHENTELPQDLKLESFKNFIASHIETTIQNIRNMIGAYTPIDMEILRDASINHSSKGDTSKQMTLMNPAVIYEMQYENMTGKKVIGIAATGEKASFMWHYWLNDIIRENPEEFEKYGRFNHSLKRVQNRSKGEPTVTNINTLPDVNLEGIDVENILKLTGYITVDGMISQTLSAATDNAKELILAKINAGSKLAKCYLYLITMGYDINDIVKFMTSDVLTFIDTFTEDNIYEGLNLTIDQAIELAEGKIPYSVEKHFLSKKHSEFKSKNKGWEESLNNGMELENPYSIYNENYGDVQNFIDFINEVKAHRPAIVNLDDIADFRKILAGANEFSNLGRILGLNQGLPTSKVDLRNLLDFIKKIITDRELELEITNKKGEINDEKLKELGLNEKYLEIIGTFDPVKFLRDSDYRQLVIEYQNEIKENIPIFKIVEDIPQFKAILTLLGTVEQLDHLTSTKSKLFDKIMDNFKERSYYVDEFMQKGILSYIDDLLVLDFLKQHNYNFPIESGTEIFDAMWKDQKIGTSISLTTPHGIASFKKVFENIVIPQLQKGQYYDGTQIITKDALKNNKFIQNLIRATDGDIPLYKANLDMLAKDASANNIIKFQDYINGLKELQSYEINEIPLSDWFMIYNLIVNKNKYGSDRMTTLLQEFISENKSNFLTKYLNHIGKIDYKQKVDISYSLEDALVATAKTVSSEFGHKEPMLIVSTENGPQLMIRNGYDYEKFDQLIPPISGETKEQYLQRLTNRLEYGTLRINYNSFIQESIKQLSNLDPKTITILNDLIKQGALIIDNVCNS